MKGGRCVSKGRSQFRTQNKVLFQNIFKVTFISFQMNHKQEGHVFFIPDGLLKDWNSWSSLKMLFSFAFHSPTDHFWPIYISVNRVIFSKTVRVLQLILCVVGCSVKFILSNFLAFFLLSDRDQFYKVFTVWNDTNWSHVKCKVGVIFDTW